MSYTTDKTGSPWGGHTDESGMGTWSAPASASDSSAGWQTDAGSLPDVACGVTSCKYHSGGDHCTAHGITVQNEHAQKRAETYCSTFTARAE